MFTHFLLYKKQNDKLAQKKIEVLKWKNMYTHFENTSVKNL